ncbi:MAG: ABC transporter ATP-binding protein [Rhodospirillaceae bacterium]|nr:ABC transporter ATP-binding protein [Rhodospirillaceae bacterium]
MSELRTRRLIPITIDGLCISAQSRLLLTDITCSICTEGVTVIMGPNGAGKSLLMRCLHGLRRPKSGRITFGGRSLDEALLKRQSFVFQTPTVLRRTVYENLAFVARLRPEVGAEALEHLLMEMRLEHLRDQSARLLSGGEKQRLAMARALLTAPDLLLMDEATANLDPASIQIIEAGLLTAVKRGLKIIIVTHDIGQARRLACDVLFLDSGRLAEHTPAESFFKAPRSAAAAAYLQGNLTATGWKVSKK